MLAYLRCSSGKARSISMNRALRLTVRARAFLLELGLRRGLLPLY